MTGPVVCGIAAAEATELASLAAAYAARLGVGLVLAHSGERPFVADRPFATSHERTREAEAVERAGLMALVLESIELGPGVRLRRVIEFGEPAQTLRQLAEQQGAALLVVGRRRLGALDRAALGSSSAALAREAPCPVLVVPQDRIDATQRDSGPVIVCGIDGSEDAAGAALMAAALAGRLGDDLVLASVSEDTSEPRFLRTVAAAQAIARDSRVEVEGREGEVAEQLAACARERRAELLVVGSRGRGAVRAAILGSVSRRLLEVADRPVLVVTPGAATPGADTS